MRTVLAGDIGGTKCRFALISADYGVHCAVRVDTVRDRPVFLENLKAAVHGILAQREGINAELAASGATDAAHRMLEPPEALGFGSAGVIPVTGESIDYAPNLPLEGFPMAQFLREEFALPVTLINDGRASAWGEYLRGHAAGRDPLLCLFFGTGVGIGLIADKTPYGGGSNAAGEIGHTIFRPGGRKCPCGRLGHFEAYCGGRAMIERAALEISPKPASDSRHRDAWNVDALVALAASTGPGSDIAQGILDDAAEAICTIVTNACILLNPRSVVLGGGVLSGWPELRDRIVKHVQSSTNEPIRKDLQFVPSLGGSDAILWGAAAATQALWRP